MGGGARPFENQCVKVGDGGVEVWCLRLGFGVSVPVDEDSGRGLLRVPGGLLCMF